MKPPLLNFSLVLIIIFVLNKPSVSIVNSKFDQFGVFIHTHTPSPLQILILQTDRQAALQIAPLLLQMAATTCKQEWWNAVRRTMNYIKFKWLGNFLVTKPDLYHPHKQQLASLLF